MNDRPSCPECGSNNVYVRVSSDELVCRRCGYIGEKERDKSEEDEKFRNTELEGEEDTEVMIFETE